MISEKNMHFIMIGLLVDLNRGQKTVRQMTNEMSSIISFIAVSSIYKRSALSHRLGSSAELICVFKASTTLDLEQVSKALSSVQTQHPGAQIKLLCYDKNVQMLPAQTLPHPALVQDKALLRCSSEVWGSYEHPILGQTLSEIVNLNGTFDDVEFYSQGSAIL